MYQKPHIFGSKKITEAYNPKWSAKFVRGYRVLHAMLRDLMSLFIELFPCITLFNFWLFCITNEPGGWGGN